jgi:hypothetical protein
VTSERLCPRCGNPLPSGHERYCASRYLAVAEIDPHQRQARQPVAAGFAAYVNRAGLIRDVALPRDDRDAGRVYAVVELEQEARR